VALICDTGPLYAALDRDDADHEACAALLNERADDLLVPAPVLVEVDWLASRRLGPKPFSALLTDVADGRLVVADLVAADYRRARVSWSNATPTSSSASSTPPSSLSPNGSESGRSRHSTDAVSA
jgi:predicted nucleic acid-binding protein